MKEMWPLAIGFLPMLAMVLFFEGMVVDQFRRRAFKPQPLVELVCEMLASDIGWDGYGSRHQTGVEVESYSVSRTSLRIHGSRVELSRADKFRLFRAVQAFRQRVDDRAANAAAIELSAKIKLMAQRVQDMSENVVSIGRRA